MPVQIFIALSHWKKLPYLHKFDRDMVCLLHAWGLVHKSNCKLGLIKAWGFYLVWLVQSIQKCLTFFIEIIYFRVRILQNSISPLEWLPNLFISILKYRNWDNQCKFQSNNCHTQRKNARIYWGNAAVLASHERNDILRDTILWNSISYPHLTKYTNSDN